MIAYVDSSVLIRILLGQPAQLASWVTITRALSSDLVRVECLRTVDRSSLKANLPVETVSRLRAEVFDMIARLELVSITPEILDRAANPLPTSLGTLDAIHLATAIQLREQFQDIALATHDQELALAARSIGFEVMGV